MEKSDRQIQIVRQSDKHTGDTNQGDGWFGQAYVCKGSMADGGWRL